jgi:hypothetical protein
MGLRRQGMRERRSMAANSRFQCGAHFYNASFRQATSSRMEPRLGNGLCRAVAVFWLVLVPRLNVTAARADDIVLARPGYYTFKVNNATISTPFSSQLLTVDGSNNTILIGAGSGFGHNHVTVNGNDNYIDLGPKGGFLVVNGTGNTAIMGRADNAVTDLSSGNTLVVSPTAATYVVGTPGAGLKIDFTRRLLALDCGFGCDPHTVLQMTTTRNERSVFITTRPNAKGRTAIVLDFRGFLPCGITFDRILAGAVIPGPRPETWKPLPAAAKLSAPDTVVPNDITLVGPAGLTVDQAARINGFWGPGFGIADPWALATPGATLTATLTAARGGPRSVRFGGVPPGGSFTGRLANVMEALANASYFPQKGITSDSVSLTVRNSGGGSARMIVPVTIARGSVCP